MSVQDKLKYIEDRLNSDVARIKGKADNNKQQAAFLSLLAMSCGAGVTIFLGLEIESQSVLFKNIALVFGVLVTIIGGMESFFNFRGVWIKQKATLLQLYSLRNDMAYYQAGISNQTVDEGRVDAFFQQYQAIWNASNEEWTRLRQEQKQEERR